MKRGRYVAIKLEEDSMKMDKKSADFRIPRSEEWMDRRKIGGYANATALATVHRVSLGEICMEYVVTGERVHSAHRGCGYKQGERWKLCEGGRLAVEATISRVICDSSQQCRFIDVRKYRSSRSISACEILSRSF